MEDEKIHEAHEHHYEHGGHIHCSCGCHDHEDHDDDEEGGALKKILLAAVLFAVALLVEHLPVFAADGYLAKTYGIQPTVLRAVYMVLYLAAYLTCGRSVVLGAVRHIKGGKVFDEQF